MSFFFSPPQTHIFWYLRMMGVGRKALKSCLYVPQMASARSQSTALNQSAIPLLSTRRLRWIIFVPIENFFFPPTSLFFLLFLWRTMSLSVLAPFFFFPPGCFWLFLPSLPASHPMFSVLFFFFFLFFFFCVWILQDPADSRALARSHLHGRRVFQRGANRLWQRPKVSNTHTHTHTHTHNGTQALLFFNAPLMGSRIMAALYWWCLL